jgi:hypothetical protein
MKINILSIILLVLCNVGCVPLVDHVYSIKIQNNTTDTIQFYDSYVFPDTTIINEKPRLIMAYPSKFSYLDSKEKWEDILPSDTISIYILSKDTLNTYSWETIRNEYKILKRYDLSLQDLEMLHYEVPYPPLQNMENIKQFPKYE